MTPYANKSGTSGVRSYAIGEQSIAVSFTSGETYVYTYASAGKQRIETMKKLAAKGVGLSTFITREVRERYARKS